jgi:hypothetical protein
VAEFAAVRRAANPIPPSGRSTPTKFPVVAKKARSSGLECGLLAEKAESDPFGLCIAFGFEMEGVYNRDREIDR